jgi:hypothetical protein
VTVQLRAEPPYEDVLFVAQNMRASDREEIYATQWTATPEELANNVVHSGAFRWGAYVDDIPVAMIGAQPRWPGVWTAWAFGTIDWRKVALTLTKHVRRFMVPALLNHGALRVDAFAMASHEESRAWLTRLGATPGNPLDKWGRNGETFVAYSWLREDNAANATAA